MKFVTLYEPSYNNTWEICHRSFFLLVLMPVISGKLKIHDSLLIAIFMGCEVISGALKPVASSLWLYYLFEFFGTVGYCKFGLIRDPFNNVSFPSWLESGPNKLECCITLSWKCLLRGKHYSLFDPFISHEENEVLWTWLQACVL